MDSDDEQYYWDPDIYGPDIAGMAGALPVNNDPDVLGSAGWNPAKNIMSDYLTTNETEDDSQSWFDSLANAFGSALGNVGNNALNAASQNANAALAKKYGVATTNANGTTNVPASKVTPAMLFAGAAVLGVILYLTLKKAS